MKAYCTQNDEDCSTCSLVNYNKDCKNNPVWGGKREGAGRPSTGRKKHQIYVTEEEYAKVKQLIENLRNGN